MHTPRLLESQARSSDLSAAPTNDAAFDAAYSLRLIPLDAARQLSPALRSAILGLGGKGPAGGPCLVFLPGYLAVLFPTMYSDLAFHVPPYWVSIDANALLAQFASDLAVKNRLINAVLALPGEAKST